MYRGEKEVVLETAELEKVKVEAVVAEHLRGPKVRIFKYKPKKGYRRHAGHRQELTRLEVTDVKLLTRKPAAKAEEKPAAEAKPAATAEEKPKPAGKAQAAPKARAEAKPKTVAKKPAAKKPAPKKPAPKKPAAKKPAPKKPAARRASSAKKEA
jgi:hypothetical protein